MRKKAEGNSIWYLVTAILVVMVVVVGIFFVLRANPIKFLTDLLPVSWGGGDGGYQGLCKLEEVKALSYRYYKASRGYRGYDYCYPLIYIKGDEDCKEDEVTFDCWLDKIGSDSFITNPKFKFDENYLIKQELTGYFLNDRNYYCYLTIDGKKPLTTKGREFDKLEFRTNCFAQRIFEIGDISYLDKQHKEIFFNTFVSKEYDGKIVRAKIWKKKWWGSKEFIGEFSHKIKIEFSGIGNNRYIALIIFGDKDSRKEVFPAGKYLMEIYIDSSVIKKEFVLK